MKAQKLHAPEKISAPVQQACNRIGVIDNRSIVNAQLQRQILSNNSPQARQLKKHLANLGPPLQRVEDDEPVQGIFSGTSVTQRAQAAHNNTGLPDQLKSGIESLSGMSMDKVKVHYNSAQPAQLNAHAYAQGSDIHVAPGQEQHLPHEAWHVVQQAQGRVKPTMQMKYNRASELHADSAHAVQLKPALGQVTWGVTHAVKEIDGSIYGDGGYAEGEIGPWGELTFGEVVVIDDDDLFMSRRGANQENTEIRQKDAENQPSVEWVRILKIKGVDVTGLNVYVRSETIHAGEDVRDPEARWAKVTVEDVAWNDDEMVEGVRKIGEEYEAVTSQRSGKEVGRNICSTPEMDQDDEGADVASEFLIEDYRDLSGYGPGSRTKIAREDRTGTMIGVMQITVEGGDSEKYLYIKWLLGSRSTKGGGVALIRSALEYAIENAITKVKVESAMSAVDWYQKRGFSKLGNAQHMNDHDESPLPDVEEEVIDCGCAEMELQFQWSDSQ